jgi:hypothetical protein
MNLKHTLRMVLLALVAYIFVQSLLSPSEGFSPLADKPMVGAGNVDISKLPCAKVYCKNALNNGIKLKHGNSKLIPTNIQCYGEPGGAGCIGATKEQLEQLKKN